MRDKRKFYLNGIETDHFRPGRFLFQVEAKDATEGVPQVFISLEIARSMFEAGTLVIKDKALLKEAKSVFYKKGVSICVK